MKMAKQFLNPFQLGELQGPFSHGVRAGNTIWISAQVGQDAHGSLVGPGDAERQCRTIFERITAILAAGGATLSDVVMLRGFLRRREDIHATWKVRKELFGEHRPASTTFIVSDMDPEGALISFEVVASVEEPTRPEGSPQ